MIFLRDMVVCINDDELPKLAAKESHCIVLEKNDWVIHIVRSLAQRLPTAIFSSADFASRLTSKHPTLLESENLQLAEWKYTRRFNTQKAIAAIAHAAEHQTVIILPLNIDTPSQQESFFLREDMLQRLTTWAYQANKIFIIALYGHSDTLKTRSLLTQSARMFTSLSFVYHELTDIRWKASFWFTGYAVNQWSWTLTLCAETNKLQLNKQASENVLSPLLGHNAPRLFLKSAIKMNEKLPTNWTLVNSDEHLLAQLTKGSDALIVLGLASKDAFYSTAQKIYNLRKLHGPHLRIIVRSLTEAVRLQDERALIAAGATMVLPNDLSFRRLLNLADNTVGSLYSHTLPKNIDQLHIGKQRNDIKGYATPLMFINAVRELTIQAQQQNTHTALIQADVATGLTATSIVRRFGSRRAGDVITSIDKQLYIFLVGCRESDIDYALNMSLGIPTQTIFTRQVRLTAPMQILDLIEQLEHHERQYPTADLSEKIKHQTSALAAPSKNPTTDTFGVQKISYL